MLQCLQTLLPKQRERISNVLILEIFERRIDRHFCARHQRLKQLCLALEVVINRAARHPCGVSHLRQRRMADATLAKHALGRVKQLFARLERLFFGTSSHLISFEIVLQLQ